jgi:hypothetical protein
MACRKASSWDLTLGLIGSPSRQPIINLCFSSALSFFLSKSHRLSFLRWSRRCLTLSYRGSFQWNGAMLSASRASHSLKVLHAQGLNWCFVMRVGVSTRI